MDQSFNKKLKSGALALALVLMMTACSSSQVEEGAAPAESVADVQPGEASTDAVPSADPELSGPIADDPAMAQDAAPGSLASSADAPPMGDPSMGGSDSMAAGDAPPMNDPSMASADPSMPTMPEDAPPMSDPNMVEPGIADAPAPMTDNNAMASAVDLPADPSLDPNYSADPAPVESGNRDYLAGVDPTPKKSKKKNKKGSSSRVASHRSGHTAPYQPSVSADGTHYTVKQGDTLMKIAFENYGDLYRWREIYESNRNSIQDPNHVPPGTQLVLNGAGMVQIERNGEQYLIHRGETLGSISHNVYGTTRKWKRLWENNRQLIKDPNKIYAGFYLYYQPEGKLTNEPAAIEGTDSAAVRPSHDVIQAKTTAVVVPTLPRSPASAKQ
jgi:nucleoid-associated protein YgaU